MVFNAITVLNWWKNSVRKLFKNMGQSPHILLINQVLKFSLNCLQEDVMGRYIYALIIKIFNLNTAIIINSIITNNIIYIYNKYTAERTFIIQKNRVLCLIL